MTKYGGLLGSKLVHIVSARSAREARTKLKNAIPGKDLKQYPLRVAMIAGTSAPKKLYKPLSPNKHMAGLPRHIIKKYGVSKKAWAVYRSGKSKRKSFSKNRGRIMAKRRSVKRYVGSKFNLKSELVPLGVATVSEPIVDRLIQQFAGQLNNIIPIQGVQIDDLIKVGGGVYLSRRPGMLGKVAKYYGVFGLRNIIRGFTGGVLAPQNQAATTGFAPTF